MSKFPMGLVSTLASVHYLDPQSLDCLDKAIYAALTNLNPLFNRDLVYLCIGTDRATGDCLGPLVGTLLKARLPNLNLFGTLETPSHAVNLTSVLSEIHRIYMDPLIIPIDASLGHQERIGYITVQSGGLTPGTALHKTLPTIGDFHISAVVNVGGYLEQIVLQNTRLHVVYKMAEIIAKGLFRAHIQHDLDKRLYQAAPASN